MAADFKLRAVMEYADRSAAGIKQTDRNLDGLQDTIGKVRQAISAMAVVEMGKAVFELGRLGAQSIRTRQAFEAISGGAEEAGARLAAMERATRGALSEQEAMAAANRLMQMGLADNAEELERVTTMAVRLGSAMGRDATDSMEQFALLLANQSIPRLDTFGISAGKVRTRIRELQAATEGMTREQAFMQAVMEEGTVAMERLGEAVEDEALAFERAEATAANLKAELGERLAPTIATVLETGLLLLQWNERMTEAQAVHAQEVASTAGSYEEYVAELVRAAGVTGMMVDEEGNLIRVHQEYDLATGMVLSSTREVVQANFALSESEFQVRRATEEAIVGLADMPPQLRGVRAASDETGTSLDGLSTAAGKVARSFGEMTFDNTMLWNMALASKASIEELSELAELLGIATDAEINNTLEAYQLVEAFGEGAISAEQLEEGFDQLAMETQRSRIEMADARGELVRMRGGMVEGAQAVEGLTQTLPSFRTELGRAEVQAAELRIEVESIPREIHIDIYYHVHGKPEEFQTGTRYARGGMALVGERGPELIVLPRGAQVFPWSAPETQAVRDARQYHYAGDTVIINDQMAAALYLEEKRRRQVARAEGRM